MQPKPHVVSLSVLALGLLIVSESSGQITNGYSLPRSKAGLHTFYGPDDIRKSTHDSVQLGSKTYNVFWHGLEAPNVPSSDQPNLSCPVDHVMVPANATEKAARGYHRYRCISTWWTELLRQSMLEDQEGQDDIQAVAVIWGSPEQYRNAGCEGSVWNNEVFKLGCVPRDNAMDDFEDFVNYLAFTFSGQSGSPKISHYAIWNEVGSSAWFDNSPIIPTHRELSIPEMTAWASKYASMLTRAHVAIQRHTSGVLMHAVLDGFWYHNTASGQALQPFSGIIGDVLVGWNKVHIGSRTVLDGLWALVGLSVDWSVSIHPYGEPSTISPAWMNFGNVPALVAYQNQKLVERGVTPTLNRAQEAIFASEVAWPSDADAVCRAHDISVAIPNIVGYTPVMHITNEDGNPNAHYPIFASTNPAVWKVRNDHHCCETQGLGCVAWQQVTSSSASDVGIGADGSVWAIGATGAIYRRAGTTWQTLPGAAARVDVGPDGTAWIVNGLGQIFHWDGSTWIGLPGGARDIGVGANGSVWIIGTDNGIYRWTGSSWQSVPGAAARIDVGPDGVAWVVAANGEIYRWNGSIFEYVPGLAQDVSVGADGSVFVTGGAPGSGNGAVYRHSATAGFVPVGGTGTQIAAGPNDQLWVIQVNGTLHTR